MVKKFFVGDCVTININENNGKFNKEILYSDVVVLSKNYNLKTYNVLVNFKGNLTKKKDIYFLSGELSANLKLFCDSCLEVVDFNLLININEKFSQSINDKEDVFYIINSSISLKEPLISNIYLNIPLKCICKDGCKGLCKYCGTNLNIDSCNCSVNDSIDSRFVGLLDMFNNEEV